MSIISSGYIHSMVAQLRDELGDFEQQTVRTEAGLAAALLASKRRHFELSTLVMALIDTLSASGTLDVHVLEARMENLQADQPWSAEHPEPLTADKPLQCVRCFIAMPMADGLLTEAGMRCARCLHKA